jgi:prepilin-type N-terminal cleavage/methylation domain-containing protein
MSKHGPGFTLIELLVVIAIIAILAALLNPAVVSAINRAKRTRVLANVKALEMAWTQYFQQYATWPPDMGGSEGSADGEDTSEGNVLRMLAGIADACDQDHNSRRMPFMQFSEDAISEGVFRDEWRRPFRFMLDRNYDNRITMPWGDTVNRAVAVWSTGPNGRDKTADDRKDDVCGWSRGGP